MHNLKFFGVKTSHGQTRIHKTHHNPDLGEASTFPLIVYFVPFHEAHIQIAFPELGFMRFWDSIILCADLRLKWGLKQSCSLLQELSNDMSHATYTQGNRVNSWLLAVGSQTANLTPDFSFGHNLCLRCPNVSCEFILDIGISRNFQWYKNIFNLMGFDPYNRPMKIWECIGTPTPKLLKWEFTWECEGSFPHSFLLS
jgi:hypothetical protein